MKVSRGYDIWFVTGSQHLYGPETLRQVEDDAKKMVDGLNEKGNFAYNLVFKTVLTTSEEITALVKEANATDSCAAIVGWMHTFSPAKMWIRGLSILEKPFLHLHTQFNKSIPWDAIDMDFMNLNQSAHGGREFGFINTRLRVPRKVVVGYWEEAKVLEDVRRFIQVAVAISESRCLKVARFGDNMRFVAVTEGDKVEAEIKFGWQVNGFGIGDLVKVVDEVTDDEVDALYEEYKKAYTIVNEDDASVASIKYQAKLEIAMERFLEEGGFTAFTTTFENLYGLEQLPGLAVQRLMDKGYGFGAEGDWKTAAMLRLTKIMGMNEGKGTSFMEDYTYHFDGDNGIALGAHMLEVCPSIAQDTPKILVNPLGIGGKADPARFIFSSKTGPALNASLVDMGGRMRLIINTVESVEAPHDMPKLPVAKAMWKPNPSLNEGAKAWILAGGAHHTVFTLDVTAEQLEDFAEFMDIETVMIDKNTSMDTFRQNLKISDLMWNLKTR